MTGKKYYGRHTGYRPRSLLLPAALPLNGHQGSPAYQKTGLHRIEDLLPHQDIPLDRIIQVSRIIFITVAVDPGISSAAGMTAIVIDNSILPCRRVADCIMCYKGIYDLLGESPIIIQS